jgi:hypothetical protein
MISKEHARKTFGEETIQRYQKEIDNYRQTIFKKEKNKDWEGYVSLIFLNKMGIDTTKLAKFSKNAQIIVHPGWTIFTEYARNIAKSESEKYGDYEEEYLKPLMKKIQKTKDKKQTIMVYTNEERLRETIDIVGEDVFLIPTSNLVYVSKNILGSSSKELLDFLSENGIEQVEISGEWVGACFDDANKKFKNYDSKAQNGFEIKEGSKYPVRGRFFDNFLFSMNKEEEERERIGAKKIRKWVNDTYQKKMSELDLKDDSCESKLLRLVLEEHDSNFIFPFIIKSECDGHNEKEIEDSIKLLRNNNIIKVGDPLDFFSDKLTEELDIGKLTLIRNYDSYVREEENNNYTTDKVIIPMIRRNI